MQGMSVFQASRMQIMHSACAAHCRDLKPENFLLASKAEDSQLKGCDFGLSVFFTPDQLFTDIVGSAYYVAPEVRHLTSQHRSTCNEHCTRWHV